MRRTCWIGVVIIGVVSIVARELPAQHGATVAQPVALRSARNEPGLSKRGAMIDGAQAHATPYSTPSLTHGAIRAGGLRFAAQTGDTARLSVWWAPAASAVVPGAGQVLLRQQRSVAYAVAEGYLIVQALSAQRDGNRERRRYRDLAAEVARKPFSMARPTGNWDYYETLEKFTESGVYDRISGGAVDPETDPSTYNGRRWLLARETFWRDPDVAPPTGSVEYTRALNFYLQSAVKDEFRWSWRDAQLQQNVYVQTIASANRSYQRANNLVGLIGANHLASLVDAYISVRIRRFGGAGVGALRVDGVSTKVLPIGDPADGRRMVRMQLRLISR